LSRLVALLAVRRIALLAAIGFAVASFVETAVAQTAPTITNGSTTTFVFGRTSFFTVTTTGVPTPSITETGPLPTGVTFNDIGNGTATLQGTPTGPGGIGGIYSLTITASNGVSPNASQAFRLVVDQAPSITSAVSTTFRIGVSGNFTVTTSGFSASSSTTLSFSGTLPTGVSFLDNGNGTATLGGTPAAGTAGNYPITIFANNGVLPSAEQAFTLTVSQAGTTTLLSSSQNPSSFGQPVTFTATVAGSSPTGTVTFLDGVTQIGTATLSGGTASLPLRRSPSAAIRSRQNTAATRIILPAPRRH
jgi:large repetitive protein